MSEKEIMDFMQPYMNEYGAVMFAEGNNPTNEKLKSYAFKDDKGIYISIYPNAKAFCLDKPVGEFFKLSSGKISPPGFLNDFHDIYMKFRNHADKLL